jgi:hypothetical protein
MYISHPHGSERTYQHLHTDESRISLLFHNKKHIPNGRANGYANKKRILIKGCKAPLRNITADPGSTFHIHEAHYAPRKGARVILGLD